MFFLTSSRPLRPPSSRYASVSKKVCKKYDDKITPPGNYNDNGVMSPRFHVEGMPTIWRERKKIKISERKNWKNYASNICYKTHVFLTPNSLWFHRQKNILATAINNDGGDAWAVLICLKIQNGRGGGYDESFLIFYYTHTHTHIILLHASMRGRSLCSKEFN